MKTDIRMRVTLMPARRVASALPPTAKTWRPHVVRVVMNAKMAHRPTRMSPASGMPRSDFSTSTAAIVPIATTTQPMMKPRSRGGSKPARVRLARSRKPVKP